MGHQAALNQARQVGSLLTLVSAALQPSYFLAGRLGGAEGQVLSLCVHTLQWG